MPTLTTFLGYNGTAEEAVNHYVSIIPGAIITSINRLPDGSVLGVAFELFGKPYVALNGGPMFTFTIGVSFAIMCDTQDEIDHYWTRLSEGGSTDRCGWLKDRYGLSWQVVPSQLGTMLGDADPARAGRVLKAMMAMTRFDIAALEAAQRGDS